MLAATLVHYYFKEIARQCKIGVESRLQLQIRKFIIDFLVINEATCTAFATQFFTSLSERILQQHSQNITGPRNVIALRIAYSISYIDNDNSHVVIAVLKDLSNNGQGLVIMLCSTIQGLLDSRKHKKWPNILSLCKDVLNDFNSIPMSSELCQTIF